MYLHYYQNWMMPFAGFFMGMLGGLILILLAWSLVWKGMALWKAAKKGDKRWFIVFMVINTLGILEILYLYVFSKKE